MSADLSVTFTGIRFQSPFLLSSAPPTDRRATSARLRAAGRRGDKTSACTPW